MVGGNGQVGSGQVGNVQVGNKLIIVVKLLHCNR